MEAKRDSLLRAPISFQVSFFSDIAEGVDALGSFVPGWVSWLRVIFGEQVCRAGVFCGNKKIKYKILKTMTHTEQLKQMLVYFKKGHGALAVAGVT